MKALCAAHQNCPSIVRAQVQRWYDAAAMATFDEINGKRRASVRREGHKECKSFRTKSEARAWARNGQIEMDAGTIVDGSSLARPRGLQA